MNKIKSILAFVALLLCGGAWAADPIVVWDRDMSDATATRKGADGNNYTITLNNGNTFENGCLKIGSTATTGATIEIPANRGKAYTVLMRYSNLSKQSAKSAIGGVCTTRAGVKNLGVAVAANVLECKPFWNSSDYAYSADTTPSLTEGAGYVQFSYKSANKWRTWAGSSLADSTAKEGTDCGLVFTADIEKVSLGGPVATGGPAAWKNLVIESIAIYQTDNQLDHSDTKNIIFPRSIKYKATIENDSQADAVALADLSWTDTEGTSVEYASIGANDSIAIYGTGKVTGDSSKTFTIYVDAGIELIYTTNPSATHSGLGMVTFNGFVPTNTDHLNFANGLWTGTVKISNKDNGSSPVYTAKYSNGNSTICLNGTTGYLNDIWNGGSSLMTVRLEDYGETPAWNQNNGGSSAIQKIKALTGSGTWKATGAATQTTGIADGSQFTGAFDFSLNTCIKFGTNTSYAAGDLGYIIVNDDATVQIAKTWKPTVGLKLNGTVIAKGGTLGANTIFGSTATLDLSAGDEKVLTLASGKTVTFNGTLNLVGAHNGSVVLKGIASDPGNLNMVTTKLEGETSGRLIYDSVNHTIVFTTGALIAWTPNLEKEGVVTDGIFDWTATGAWKDTNDDEQTWTWKDDVTAGAPNVIFDAKDIKGVKIEGKITAGEVHLVNTADTDKPFDFHNRTLDVNGTNEVDPSIDCLSASAVVMTTYNGKLGLKVPIIGAIGLGDDTDLVFKTGTAGGTASKAYAYAFGRVSSIGVEGSGKFIVPTSMYGVPFAPNDGASIVYDSASNVEVSGEISGSGSVIKEGMGTLTFTGSNSFTGGTIINNGTLMLGSQAALGAQGATVTVNPNGVLDVAGKNDYAIVLTLAGGTLKNSVGDVGTGVIQVRSITLTADSTIDLQYNAGIVNNGHAATTLDLGTHKLTKSGNGTFFIVNTTVSNGTIQIDAGSMKVEQATCTLNNVKFTVPSTAAANMVVQNATLTTAPVNTVFQQTERAGGEEIILVSSGQTPTYKLSTGNDATIKDGDVIVINGSKWQANRWVLSNLPSGHVIKITNETDIDSIPANVELTINYKDYPQSGNKKGVYLRGNIGANAAIDGVGALFLGFTANSTIADGVVISCDVGFQSSGLHQTIVENATVTFEGVYNHIAGSSIKLNAGSKLIVAEKLPNGAVESNVNGKIVVFDSATKTYSLIDPIETTQTWSSGDIIFDGDFHGVAWDANGVGTKTINGVTYTINLNGHEIVTENGKSYVLIKSGANANQLGVTVAREATNNTGYTMVVKYSDFGYTEGASKKIPLTINDNKFGNIVSPYVVSADGAMKAGWANFYNNVEHAASSGRFDSTIEMGYLAMSYGTSGARVYQMEYSGWTEAYNANIYGGGTYNITGVAVGGLYTQAANNSTGNSAVVADGMKIYALAVTATPITSTTDSKLTGLSWPSDLGKVAKVGQEGFETVEAAIEAAETGAIKTARLVANIEAGDAINIPTGVTLDIAGHDLARGVTGSGTLIINKNITRTSGQNEDNDVNLPSALTTSLKDAANWHGEVVLVGGFNHVQMNPLFNLCNSSSKLTSKGNKGWLLQNSLENIKLNLVDDGATPALYISNSSYQWKYKAKLAGEGTIKVDSASGTPTAAILVKDATDFRGNIHMTDLSLYFGEDGAVLGNGLIKINSGVEMKVYPDKIWHAGPGGIEVAGTIKGSGTLEGTVSFDAGSTLDLTDGMLTATTATAAGAFTVKVNNLETFLAGEKKVMTLTAGGNTISAAQVTVTDGTNNAPTTYVLKATPTAAVLVAPESHTWTGATDGSLNNAANWGATEMFSGDNQFVVFPAEATQKTITVSDITLGKITINGAYTFTGKGTITLSDLEFGADGSLVLGTGTTLKFPGAINKALLAKITFAGGTYAFENLPAFTASDVFTVDATNLAPDSYVLASWTGKMALNQSGYGKPTVNVTGLSSAYSTRVVCLVGKLYVQVIDTAAQAKKKTYKVWAVGDSITEGYNSNSTCANYRTQLAAKLALAGYNIEMVGYYDHRNKMPSGEDAPAEWSFHSGVSGQRIWTRSSTGRNSTHAGYIDAIDAALFQVGKDVDVVTVLLGTNDLGNGSDTVQHTFDGWKIVVKKILAGCPNAKVVVSPLIDMHSGGGSGSRSAYNELITNGITEANFGSDVSRIYNAKLDEYVIGDSSNLMFNDVYHPSWDGHDAMSTGWFDTIKKIIDKDALAVAPTPKAPAALGVENNAADYAEGFTRIRKLEIPQQVAYALNEAPKYSAITEVADVTKVGYYMELVRDDASDMRYVWVDMDVPAGVTLDKLLVPTGANLQCVVNNLHVKSNMGSVTEVAKDQDGVNGFIEFSPYGAASGAASGVAGAPAETWTAGEKAYNWNDTLATSGNGRGVMQIHRIFDSPATDAHGGEVLFAWNNWGAGNTVEGQKNGEIGIGNFAQHYMADNSNGGIGKKVGLTLASGLSMDYTFLRWDRWGDRMNTKAYTVRNLEIWAKGTVTKHHLMSDEEEVQVEATTEEAALEKAVIDVQDSEADAAANTGAGNTQGQAQFLTLKATRVGSSDNWKVQAVVDNEKLPTNKKIDDTAVAFANAGGIVKLAGATEKQTISIPKTSTTAGLYYSVSFGTSPDNHTEESERVLATSGAGTVDIPVPALGNEKVYYIKVKASATK